MPDTTKAECMDADVEVSVLLMTCPARCPERAPLFRKALACAISQRLANDGRLEVVVLDDKPLCAAWPMVAAATPLADTVGAKLRYVALPADDKGRVNMRLKRNAALLLCTGRVAVFFDDDDWRSESSVQEQLDALANANADFCTLQVSHVCELDPFGGSSVRYFATPGGGRIFSARLGNPGTAMLRRVVWEANPSLGFPDTPCEDVDYARLLIASSPMISSFRPRRCEHTRLDACSEGSAAFMTVRLVGFRHVWPLQPLALNPLAGPPEWLPEADAVFYERHCARLAALRSSGADASAILRDEIAAAEVALLPPPPPPADPLNLDAVMAEAARRMASANQALTLLSAFVQAQAHTLPQSHGPAQALPPVQPRPAHEQSQAQTQMAPSRWPTDDGREAVLIDELTVAMRPFTDWKDDTTADGACASGDARVIRALDSLRLASDAHRQAVAAGRGPCGAPAAGFDSAARGTSSVALGDDETAVAQRVIESGVLRGVAGLLEGCAEGRLGMNVAAAAASLVEEVLFRTAPPQDASARVASMLPTLARALTLGCGRRQCDGEPHDDELASVGSTAVAATTADTVAAAAAGAMQHLLTRSEEQLLVARLPAEAVAMPLVAALTSKDHTVRRRACGAIANAAACNAALGVLVDVGAAASIARHLDSPYAPRETAPSAAASAALGVSLRALERLCLVSAIAREDVRHSLPEFGSLSLLADQLSSPRCPAAARASASRILAALSRSESRHWLPTASRAAPRVWPPRSIAYYTGVALESWGPERLETGLGGSETAALLLAAEWASTGREVVLYLRMCEKGGEAERDVGGGTFVGASAPSISASASAAAASTTAPIAAVARVPGERTWRGVRLLPVELFNPQDTFDTLIVWRSMEILDELLPTTTTALVALTPSTVSSSSSAAASSTASSSSAASNTVTAFGAGAVTSSKSSARRGVLLDLHDMPNAHEMTSGRLAKVSALMLKSDFQRASLPPRAAQMCAVVIPNGVDEALIARARTEVMANDDDGSTAPTVGMRRPLRLIYTSSYDRGLEHMLRHGWPLIAAALPTAELHLYYGWRTHELLHPSSAWRDEMRDLIGSFGGRVIDHGRVGQLELLRAKARAQILYYVGDWPEIDCIAVREAAMLGCVPLTSSVAVFGDAAKDYVVRVEGDPAYPQTQRDAAAKAIAMLKDYERTGFMPSVDTPTLREETWSRVAARWLQHIDSMIDSAERPSLGSVI